MDIHVLSLIIVIFTMFIIWSIINKIYIKIIINDHSVYIRKAKLKKLSKDDIFLANEKALNSQAYILFENNKMLSYRKISKKEILSNKRLFINDDILQIYSYN